MMRSVLRPALIGAALLSSGCYRMTIVNGRPPAPAPIIDDKWRSATVLDAVEIDTPLPLDRNCKETGWAKIEQRQNAVNWLVDVFLAGFVYESTHVDVYCADGRAIPAASASPSPDQAEPDKAPAPPASGESSDL